MAILKPAVHAFRLRAEEVVNVAISRVVFGLWLMLASFAVQAWYMGANGLHKAIDEGRCNIKNSAFASTWPPGETATERAKIAMQKINGVDAFKKAGKLKDIHCLNAILSFTTRSGAYEWYATRSLGINSKQQLISFANKYVRLYVPANAVEEFNRKLNNGDHRYQIALMAQYLPPRPVVVIEKSTETIEGLNALDISFLGDGEFVIALKRKSTSGLKNEIVVNLVETRSTSDVVIHSITPSGTMKFTPAKNYSESYRVKLASTRTEYKQSYIVFQAFLDDTKSKMYERGAVLPKYEASTAPLPAGGGVGGASDECGYFNCKWDDTTNELLVWANLSKGVYSYEKLTFSSPDCTSAVFSPSVIDTWYDSYNLIYWDEASAARVSVSNTDACSDRITLKGTALNSRWNIELTVDNPAQPIPPGEGEGSVVPPSCATKDFDYNNETGRCEKSETIATEKVYEQGEHTLYKIELPKNSLRVPGDTIVTDKIRIDYTGSKNDPIPFRCTLPFNEESINREGDFEWKWGTNLQLSGVVYPGQSISTNDPASWLGIDWDDKLSAAHSELDPPAIRDVVEPGFNCTFYLINQSSIELINSIPAE